VAKLDPEIVAHLEWLGFVRPTGLVVSAPALVRAGAILDRRDVEGQRLLRACVEERTFDPKVGPVPHLPDFRAFATSVLGWSFSPKGYAGTTESPIPPELEVPLPDYGETLRPDFAVCELEPQNGTPPWQLLVRVLETGEDLDRVVRGNGQLEASAHGRMERLLRQTGLPAGLLFNGLALRLVSAPRGESSGWLDFRIADMVQTAGRPISTALRLLLGEPRLLSLPRPQRLAALLEDSRRFQNEVSERLAEQVLHALYELLRGFQAAHDASKGELLRQPLAEQPDEVYRALLTVILRLVFLLYAEERDMLPEDETFLQYYSLAGLYERLREDGALFPDTMDQRYGAWGQLLVLFRMIHDGAESGAMRLPKRHGVLFDPDRFKFLESRAAGGARQIHDRIEPPLVPDGTIHRALEKLLVLDGERISYRALDVEQIGSVYETMMGFRLETATGRSVAINAQKKGGASTAVDIDALLAEPAAKRAKWLQDRADRKFTETLTSAVAEATTIEDLHAALLPAIAHAATPDLVSKGAMVLQPSEERRRSGSHYTPRALTEPIVRTTLGPVLARLRGAEGRPPKPEQILELKVCDPAMGSGAFLVEACRQLGDALVEAWHAHGEVPAIPPDEDEVIFARRLVAQRCLYGVDRNPVAVDLAKVSVWLVTLAKDHALTFVDHALRHGDSLVGLSLRQIEAFHWDPDAPRFQAGFETMRVQEHAAQVAELRRSIREADESVSDSDLRHRWDDAQFELSKVRLFGDLVVAAFFEGEKPKERERKRSEYASALVSGEAERHRGRLEEWRHTGQPLAPFHWQLEFPEVFDQANSGFDAFIGNPPFLGGSRIRSALGLEYLSFLQATFHSTARADLCCYFFQRGYQLVSPGGCIGLIATNTIAQADSREASLEFLVERGATIFSALPSFAWPGDAAVIVSLVYLHKGPYLGPLTLQGHRVEGITAFLVAGSREVPPQTLAAQLDKAFHGSVLVGNGFVLTQGEAENLIQKNPKNREVLFPYINGMDINSTSDQRPSRWVVNFFNWPLNRASAPVGYSGAVAEEYPDVLEIVKDRVKPGRDALGRKSDSSAKGYARLWWQYGRRQDALYSRIEGKPLVIARPRVSNTHAPVFINTKVVFSDAVVVFVLDKMSDWAVLQSSAHEIWARKYCSTLKQDLRYSATDAFETFPFPVPGNGISLDAVGGNYYRFRQTVLSNRHEGLTPLYSSFHNPDEWDGDIAKLRDLHLAVDRAVLDAYGWTDIPTTCEFLLDYEIDEAKWGDKKKPYRYRWPDEVRDDVLARLLELNAERAKEEARAGSAATKKRGKPVAKGAGKASDTEDLFS
jgi:hypothetical protein